MPSSSTLTIDLAILRENLKLLVVHAGPVMPLIKANAHGTDPLMLAKFFQSCDVPYIGVSHVSEGIFLRQAGITLPIFIVSAPSFEADEVVEYHLTPAVSSLEEANALNEAAQKKEKKIAVHLDLNTGMNRFGVSIPHAKQLYDTIQKSSHLHLEGVMTHFSSAEEPKYDRFTHKQISLFKAFLDSLPTLPRWIHAANSAGVVRFSMPYCTLCRVGLSLFGYGVRLPKMKPVLSLQTHLSFVTTCQKGESIGYLCAYQNRKENGHIGVIPFGYYDGYPRCLSGKGYVLIQGKKAPMIGNICMDFMMIDLTDIPEAKVGDPVILFNEDLSPETVARWAETDVRELLVNIGPRVKRVWKSTTLGPIINDLLTTQREIK